uniref:Peptidase S1 domain-containing protein n=1 Tax=Heliothis virescens TaxID=7102 RepID=A0A2A4J1X5_HELVI
MHYDLKSAAEKNYDVYARMVAAAKPDMSANSSANPIELFELIEEILDDTLNYSASFRAHKKLRKHAKHKTSTVADISSAETVADPLNLSEPVFADSREFKQFIHDFVRKVDNLNENDFIKSKTPRKVDESMNDPNLEFWQPPAVLELDLVNDTYSRRIFKGERTRIKSYPFLASIHLLGAFVCAGSILSKNIVITAASCLQLLHNNRFYRENPRALYVRIGSDYFTIGGEKINVIEVFFHHEYNPRTLSHNLVLLRLNRDIKFRKKQKRVKRISYDRMNANLASDTDGIIIVGWGGRKISNIINEYERIQVSLLDIYEVNECAKIYSKKFVTHKHFCAGFISTGGGACNKDVGGPGVINGVLVGVVSFGPPVCGALDSPTVFTKLGHYTRWIDGIVQMTTANKRARTTLLYKNTVPIPMIYNRKVTRPLISPIYSRSEASDEDDEPPQAALPDAARHDNTYLQDNAFYEDCTEDILGMFKTTPTKLNPMHHPLVNKSLFPIHDIHTQKSSTNYVTVILTTSSTVLPMPPQLTEPEGPTTMPPSRTPPSTTEGHITDIETALPDETFEHTIIEEASDEITTAPPEVGDVLRDGFASNIVDKNFDTFNDIKNTIRVDFTKNHTADKSKLDDVVTEVLNENDYNVYKKLKGTHNNTKKHARNKKKHKTKIPEFDDSKEFADFVIEFLAKFNNLTIQDFKKSAKYVRNIVPPHKNLKAWETPSAMELKGSNNSYTRRIYKGTLAKISSFPFIVSIHIMGEFTCAGCIIYRDLVLTSASCLQIAYQNDFFHNNLKSIYVRLGSDHTTRGGETIPVIALYFHPLYDPEHLLNNLALIRLEQRIRFSRQQKRIRRIVWDRTWENLSEDSEGVLILGWGAASKDSVMPKHPKLAVGKLDVFNIDDCKDVYSEDFVTDYNFCAGIKENSGGACNGDVGGPAIIGKTLVGVVSFGALICGTIDAPTVFTKIGFYSPWIESIVNLQGKEKPTYLSIDNTRRGAEKIRIHFNATVLDKNNKQDAHIKFRNFEEYPEEVTALRKVLMDLVRTDTKVVDEVIYGDLYDEFSKLFKSNEETGDTVNRGYERPATKKSMIQLSDQGFSGESVTPIVTTASTPAYHLQNMFSESCSSSESDMEHRNALRNDYTDNYEGSSNEEGLSIEIPNTVIPLEKSDKSEVSSDEYSDSLNDDDTIARNRMETSREREEITQTIKFDKSKSVPGQKKHIPFSGTRSFFDYSTGADDTPKAKHGKEERKTFQNKVVKEGVAKSNTFAIHYHGKSLATRPYFVDLLRK